MRKILVPLLVLALLFICAAAPAEDSEAVKLELNTTKLPVYTADDPYVAELGINQPPEADALPVLVLPVKKNLQLQVSVMPKSLKNKKITLNAADEDLVKIKGNTVTGLNPGETVLTIASQEDPSATLQYRILVIQPVTRLSVNAAEKSVAVGQNLLLTPVYIPDNATLKAVTWSSSNESIVTVDENGMVTGIRKGNARINATAKDGSNIRANINVKVTQSAEEITLDKPELTVDISKTAMLKATVLPKNTDNKKVVWASSDESIAKVNGQGRITGTSLGDCEIICTSETNGEVFAKALVHVQQPVKKISFANPPAVYAGESAKLTWSIEPADATNQSVAFKSGNEKILTVSDDGTVTGIKAGETFVNVTSKDGSNRQARVKIKVYQHVTGVHMKRHTAYIDTKTSSTTTAILEPSKGINTNMSWISADTSVATVKANAKQSNKVSITGVKKGETVVTGTTEDGGFQASIRVKVGDFSHMLKITKAEIGGKGQLYITVKNVSDDLPITYVKLEVEAYYSDGTPSPVNAKNGSNVLQLTYSKKLNPGEKTPEDKWKIKDYDLSPGFQKMVVRIVEYQIDNDWVKALPKNRQPKYVYDPYK